MKPDHADYREWLNLEADGRLPRDERTRLEQHLAACSSCRSELDGQRSLEGLLAQARVPVRESFRSDVLAALPAADWEARAPRTWGFPVAMFVLLFCCPIEAYLAPGLEGLTLMVRQMIGS